MNSTVNFLVSGACMIGMVSLFAATTTDTTDKDMSSGQTIDVSGTDVLVWSGALTGAGTLTKTGTGTLVLNHDNAETFSGDIVVAGGAVRMDCAGALGTGMLRSTVAPVKDMTYGYIFNAADAVVANPISLESTTARLNGAYDISAQQNVTLTGGITATAGGVAFTDTDSAVTTTVQCAINAGTKKDVFFKGKGRYMIKGPITCSSLRPCSTTRSPTSYIHFFPLPEGQAHSVGSIFQNQNCLVAEGENTLPYIAYSATSVSASYNGCFDIDLNGYNQEIKGLSWNSGTKMGASAKGAYVRSTGGPSTLTITTGGVSGRWLIADEVSLVINLPSVSKVQGLLNRTATTTGDLIVSNGIFRLGEEMSFTNLKNIYVCKTAAIEDQSTVSGSFAGATNMTLEAGAKFTLESSASAPFNFAEMVLNVQTTETAVPQFTIPADMTVEIAAIYVNGERLPNGEYTKANAAFIAGDGTLRAMSHNFTTGVWNNGSVGSEAVSLAANWSGVSPDLESGDMSVAVSNGTYMALDVDASFIGMVFDPSIAGFTVSGDHALTLASGGLTVPGDGTAHNWEFSAPLVLKDAGTWNIPSSDTLRTTGGLTGGGSLTFTGGTAILEGNNTFSGTLGVMGGSLTLKGVLGSAGDLGKLLQNSENCPITLDNVEIFKPCTISSSAKALSCAPGSSNVIHGAIGGCIFPTMPADSTLVIDGQMYIDSSAWTPGSQCQGTIIFTATPYVRGLANDFRANAGTNIYAFATDSTYCRNWYLTYGTSYTRFDNDRIVKVAAGPVESSVTYCTGLAYCNGAKSSCDLNGTIQTFNGCVGTAGTVYSVRPAMLEIAPLPPSEYSRGSQYAHVYSNSVFGAQLKGPVTVRFAPHATLEETTLTLQNCAFETTGALEVTNGTMIVAASATFKNLTRASLSGAGVLEIQSADAFGDALTLDVAHGENESAVLRIAANCVVCVATVSVNGTPVHVRPGLYTMAGFAAKMGEDYAARFTGEGLIRVMGSGTQLFLR